VVLSHALTIIRIRGDDGQQADHPGFGKQASSLTAAPCVLGSILAGKAKIAAERESDIVTIE
jgi:hypothetical protein